MTGLTRGAAGHPAVRHVHLGLGNFFRAHQAWYTDRAPDGTSWPIAAFTGRSAALATALSSQDGLYTLVTRAADGDSFEVVSSLAAAHPAADHAAWLGYLADPSVALVSLTVTEAGYLRGADGGLARSLAAVRTDVESLRADLAAPVSTAPARLVAGLAARWHSEAGPLTLVPCDNLPDNGAVLARVVRDCAELIDPTLADWIGSTVSFATTVVDRITPAVTEADLASVLVATGTADRAPVVTEPFSEWVISGAFPAGRPAWDVAGAVLVDDVTPFEQRKLWMLNGAHSLLAYAGPLRGHRTVAEAVADDWCRDLLERWWDEAAPHLPLPPQSIADYRAALVTRFANPRMKHLLTQIASDGSQKLPVRLLPVLRAERDAGRLPAGAISVLAAWICHVRDAGDRLTDPDAAALRSVATGSVGQAVGPLLDRLQVGLGQDEPLVQAVAYRVDELGRMLRP